MVQDIHNGVENLLTPNPKDQIKHRKGMLCWGSGGTGHGLRECSTPREGNNLPFRPANQNLYGRWERKHRPPVLSQSKLGRSQYQQATKENWDMYGNGLS